MEDIRKFQRFLVEKDCKYGFKDGYGNLVIECIYDNVKIVKINGNPFIKEAFVNGYAIVKLKGQWGWIDINGKFQTQKPKI